MVPSPFYFMAKSPIKSFVAASIAGGSVWYAYDYTTTYSLMKSSCRRAAFYGDQKLKNPNSQVRHITVILNPAAGNRKSKAIYSKWVEPLLHLAGIKVSLVETQSLKQVYDIMKVMSNCDGVAIVGGDETVHEALNGLLHRQDCAKAARNFPIAIIPAGQYNSIAKYVYQNFTQYRNRTEFAIRSTAQLVDSVTTQFDVLKICPINISNDTNQSDRIEKSVYALRDIRYGLYQDDYLKLTGISIYQNYIKPCWMKIQRTLRRDKFTVPSIVAISYTEPCRGCSRCYNKHLLVDNVSMNEINEKGTKKSWWGSLLVPTNKQKNSVENAELKKKKELIERDNPNCGKWIEWSPVEEVTDFRAVMIGDSQIRLSLGKSREMKPSETFEVQDVRLRVIEELDSKAQETSQETPISNDGEEEKNINPKDIKGLLIDRKILPVRSLEVSALSEAITVFTGAPKQFVGEHPLAVGRK